jgi:tetraacyldisaccharide 4'-kinase
MFDQKILPAKQFSLPVICIGNLSTGGTGKTPFTEYLINLLKKQYKVATLSRGYKRKTKGFIIANAQNTPHETGDEACQIKNKFPDVIVAVDKNRRRGIRNLLALPEKDRPDVIILDDAMQHRYVVPSLTIMLTEYCNIYYEDSILPAGNLRESANEAYRADIIVVTKCSTILKPIELRLIEKNMMLNANQRHYFSDIQYTRLYALFPDKAQPHCSLDRIDKNENILLIAGIANPQPFIEIIRKYSDKVTECIFPDHHDFKDSDIQHIDDIFQKMTPDSRRIICTEKDAMRLKAIGNLPESWKSHIYYLQITINFLYDKTEEFNNKIIQHVYSTINLYKKNVKN